MKAGTNQSLLDIGGSLSNKVCSGRTGEGDKIETPHLILSFISPAGGGIIGRKAVNIQPGKSSMFTNILREVSAIISICIFILGIFAIMAIADKPAPELIKIAVLGP